MRHLIGYSAFVGIVINRSCLSASKCRSGRSIVLTDPRVITVFIPKQKKSVCPCLCAIRRNTAIGIQIHFYRDTRSRTILRHLFRIASNQQQQSASCHSQRYIIYQSFHHSLISSSGFNSVLPLPPSFQGNE